MFASTSLLQINIDAELKEQVTQKLAAMEMSVSDAVLLFLNHVAMQPNMPFTISKPNAETLMAMNEAEAIIRNNNARFATAQDLFDAISKEASPQ